MGRQQSPKAARDRDWITRRSFRRRTLGFFVRLREARKQLAAKEAIPVYAVCTNEQLAEMAKSRAASLAELKQIDGFGEAKAAKYGEAFLEAIGGGARDKGGTPAAQQCPRVSGAVVRRFSRGLANPLPPGGRAAARFLVRPRRLRAIGAPKMAMQRAWKALRVSAWLSAMFAALEGRTTYGACRAGSHRCAEHAGGRPVLVLDFPYGLAAMRTPRARTYVTTAAFSPRGRYLVLGTEDGHCVVWDLAHGRLAGAARGHEQKIHLTAFGESEHLVLTGADDQKVVLWDLTKLVGIRSFQGAPMPPLYEVALCPKGRYTAARGFDGFGVIWDLEKDRQVMPLFSYTFAFSPDGLSLVTAPRRLPGASIFRLADGHETKLLAEKSSYFHVAFDRTGRLVAGMTGNSIHLWDAQGGTLVRIIELDQFAREEGSGGSEPWALSMCFSSDSRRMVIGCSDGRIFLIGVQDGGLQRAWRFPGGRDVWEVRFVGRADGAIVAIAFDEDRTGLIYTPWTALFNTGDVQPLWCIAGGFAIEGEGRLAAGVTDGDLLLVDASDGTPVQRLRGFEHGKRWAPVARGER